MPQKFEVEENILLLVKEIIDTVWEKEENKEIVTIIEAINYIKNSDLKAILKLLNGLVKKKGSKDQELLIKFMNCLYSTHIWLKMP